VTTLLALGDSFSCGEGVGVRVPLDRTWTSLLGATLSAGRVTHLAQPGARVRGVRENQLPRTTGQPGEIATLLIGLNDVARMGFSPDTIRADLLATVDQLRGDGREVLLGRLHDPTTLLPLPGQLRRVACRRVAQVNAAIDEAAARSRVLLLDLADIAELADPAALAVDRIHPSPAGHGAIAVAAGAVLRAAGWPVKPLQRESLPPAPSGAQRARWLVLHGLPYATGHLPDIGRPALAALVRRA
jgi:lysophospholipase L1-like esterase